MVIGLEEHKVIGTHMEVVSLPLELSRSVDLVRHDARDGLQVC